MKHEENNLSNSLNNANESATTEVDSTEQKNAGQAAVVASHGVFKRKSSQPFFVSCKVEAMINDPARKDFDDRGPGPAF